jgi:hypothetical protein
MIKTANVFRFRGMATQPLLLDLIFTCGVDVMTMKFATLCTVSTQVIDCLF